MTSTQRRMPAGAICALLGVLAAQPAFSQAPATPPYLYSLPAAINSRGQVVGVSFNENGDSRAILWDRGVPVDLGTPAANYSGSSGAVAINEAGQVVGGMMMPDGLQHAFSWKNGVLEDLGAGGPGGMGAGATGINASGQIVGYCYGPGLVHACLWDHGTLIDLGESGGWVQINVRGQVMWVTFTGHTYLFDHGVNEDLGVVPGGTATIGRALNNRGQVIGFAELPNSEHAFLWDRGRMVDLGVGADQFPAATYSMPYAVNAQGQTVGTSYEFLSGISHALLWEVRDGGTPKVVTTALDASYAVDINDRGQILAFDDVGAISAMILDHGTKTRLPSHDYTEWVTLSQQGDVLGYRYIAVPNAGYYPAAVLWSHGQVMDLPGLDGAP